MENIQISLVEQFRLEATDTQHAIDDALDAGLLLEDVLEANERFKTLLSQYEQLKHKFRQPLPDVEKSLVRTIKQISSKLDDLNLNYRNELIKKSCCSSTLH